MVARWLPPSLPDIIVLVSLLPGSARLPGVGYHPRLPSSPLHLAACWATPLVPLYIGSPGSSLPTFVVDPWTLSTLLPGGIGFLSPLLPAQRYEKRLSGIRLLHRLASFGQRLFWAFFGWSLRLRRLWAPRFRGWPGHAPGSPDSTLVLALPGPGYSRFRSRGGPVSLDVPKGLYGVTVFRSAHFDIP